MSETLMNYLTIVKNKTKAKSIDGAVIESNYIEHPRFRETCKFCACLHYVFVRFTETRSYSKGYEIRTGINYLLDFTVIYESTLPSVLHLTSLQNITCEFIYSFDLYCKEKSAPRNLSSRLRGALIMVALENDEGMPLLTLPKLWKDDGKPNEPLADECFMQLSDSLKKHIDKLYLKLEFRKEVLNADMYDFITINKNIEKLHLWQPDHKRSLNTLIHYGFPFDISHDDFIEKVKVGRSNLKINNVVELIIRRYNNAKIRFKQKNKLITLEELLQLYYPSALDQSAIVLFIMLQTGWNKEVVMAIDPDRFEHPLAGTINSSQTLIVSEKNKSQAFKKPFFKPKAFLAPSVISDKYSTYNLIKLAKELSNPLSGKPYDCDSKRITKKYNPLFMAMRCFKAMILEKSNYEKRPGRYLPISCRTIWVDGVKKFFKEYPIFENGQRLISAQDISARLRPTWIRHNRQNKRALSVISLQQSHKSIKTTDIHYDNSGVAKQSRRKRLRIELEEITNLFHKNKFKGMIGSRAENTIDRSSIRLFNIPGHEKSLWGCRDALHPDWPGAENQGETRCSKIPKCLFCSHVFIFEDSLPFLMQRQTYLQQFSLDSSYTQYADELKIIDYILADWGDDEALKAAARYQRANHTKLPDDFSALTTAFED